MSGLEEDNKKYRRKIEDVIKGKSEYIRGFNYFLSNLAFRTRYEYINKVINFMEYTKKQESELDFLDFTSYMAHIKYKEDGQETVGSYQIVIYSALKSFSSYLFLNDVIPKDYMKDIAHPSAKEQMRTKDRRRKGSLKGNELKIYLDNVNNGNTGKSRQPEALWRQRDITILKLFLSTGMRCSALSRIDIEDLNLEEGTLNVTDKGAVAMTFNLTPGVIEEIKKWLVYREQMSAKNDSQALFLTKRRERVSPNAISDITKKYAYNIEGKSISPHKLRRTYALTLYHETNNLVLVQRCLHHASIQTTQKYVEDEDEVYQNQSVEIMKNLF